MSEEEKQAYDILLMLKYFTEEKEDKQAITTILQLVDKNQKEIEELKENQIWSEATIEGLKTDFIHKDKIREKIKELSNKNINADGISAIFNITKIQTLEELLEE